MENTIENKNKFFAQYWGRYVFVSHKLEYVNENYISPMYETSILELKPISQISDEDAVSVSNIVGWVKGKKPREYKEWIIDFFGDRSLGDRFSLIPELPIYSSLELIDYLRSKGYALPWMGLSVEQLIEYGWIKLKES